MLKELSQIPWIKAYPTQTNYILIKLNKWNEEYIFNYFFI